MNDEITTAMREENTRRAHPLSDADLIALERERERRRASKARWEILTDDELEIIEEALRCVAFGCDRPEDALLEQVEAARETRANLRGDKT